MVLILDHTKSERAVELRRRILEKKIPCAVSAVWNCSELLPAFCIITFADVLEEVCRSPLEKYKIFVLTDTWVNRALHVTPCATETELLQKVMVTVGESAGICREQYIEGSLVLPHGFLLTAECLFYRCFPLKLSYTETNILLMLLLTRTQQSARHLIAYCFPDTYKGNIQTSTSAAMYRINKTIETQSGIKLISYSKKENGYILNIRVTGEI